MKITKTVLVTVLALSAMQTPSEAFFNSGFTSRVKERLRAAREEAQQRLEEAKKAAEEAKQTAEAAASGAVETAQKSMEDAKRQAEEAARKADDYAKVDEEAKNTWRSLSSSGTWSTKPSSDFSWSRVSTGWQTFFEGKKDVEEDDKEEEEGEEEEEEKEEEEEEKEDGLARSKYIGKGSDLLKSLMNRVNVDEATKQALLEKAKALLASKLDAADGEEGAQQFGWDFSKILGQMKGQGMDELKAQLMNEDAQKKLSELFKNSTVTTQHSRALFGKVGEMLKSANLFGGKDLEGTIRQFWSELEGLNPENPVFKAVAAKIAYGEGVTLETVMEKVEALKKEAEEKAKDVEEEVTKKFGEVSEHLAKMKTKMAECKTAMKVPSKCAFDPESVLAPEKMEAVCKNGGACVAASMKAYKEAMACVRKVVKESTTSPAMRKHMQASVSQMTTALATAKSAKELKLTKFCQRDSLSGDFCANVQQEFNATSVRTLRTDFATDAKKVCALVKREGCCARGLMKFIGLQCSHMPNECAKLGEKHKHLLTKINLKGIATELKTQLEEEGEIDAAFYEKAAEKVVGAIAKLSKGTINLDLSQVQLGNLKTLMEDNKDYVAEIAVQLTGSSEEQMEAMKSLLEQAKTSPELKVIAESAGVSQALLDGTLSTDAVTEVTEDLSATQQTSMDVTGAASATTFSSVAGFVALVTAYTLM